MHKHIGDSFLNNTQGNWKSYNLTYSNLLVITCHISDERMFLQFKVKTVATEKYIKS